MEEIKKTLLDAARTIVDDLGKDSKAAAARVRKATLTIAKAGKAFRKASLEAEKAAKAAK